MAGRRVAAHRARMVEIILLLCTALAFVALVAAVPIEIGEERQDEQELGITRRS